MKATRPKGLELLEDALGTNQQQEAPASNAKLKPRGAKRLPFFTTFNQQEQIN